MNTILVHQPHIKERLDRLIQNQRISHAYLFEGNAPQDQLDAAKYLAKSLRCQSTDQHPCLKCKSCQEIDRENGLSFTIIAPSTNRSIKVEDIHDLQQGGGLSPWQQGASVIFIQDAHTFTDEAANAFLKTLEEPTQSIIFILTVKQVHDVLPTIQSRCQIMHFSEHNDAIIDFLTPEELEFIAFMITINNETQNLESIFNFTEKHTLTSLQLNQLLGYLMRLVHAKINSKLHDVVASNRLMYQFQMLRSYQKRLHRPVNIKHTFAAALMELTS